MIGAMLAAGRVLAADVRGPKGQVIEPEIGRYPDEATEFQVYRLTDPSHTSTLPAGGATAITRNSGALLYCSDRTGSPQAFRMNLKTGEAQQLTDRKDLDGASMTLLPDGRSFCYFGGRTLYLSSVPTLRERPVYMVPEGWEAGPGLSATGDGARILFVERRDGGSRLRSVTLAQAAARTILESPSTLADPVERPQRAQILYRLGVGGLGLVSADGRGNTELKLAAGGIGPSHWSADGKTLIYLSFPEDHTQLNAIREYTPDVQTDKLLANTSQYVAFSPNRDTSVFVGASRNAASPAILILLRVTRRERILCEHRASRPDTVAPFFSPDAQRIYFQSDRHGKPAIYSLHVERLVERIEDTE